MENGELFKMLSEELKETCRTLNNRLDRHEDVVRKYFDNQSVVCKYQDDRVDKIEQETAILKDRQKEAEKRQTRNITIVGIIAATISSIVATISSRLHLGG